MVKSSFINIHKDNGSVSMAATSGIWQRDILGSPPAQTAGFQMGISNYF